ncbi:hypothetical protein BS78_02G344500 [Paspalum vaginatum]|nr:hypothetical protein BS78_02G344500 [Paspalum vaginatum]
MYDEQPRPTNASAHIVISSTPTTHQRPAARSLLQFKLQQRRGSLLTIIKLAGRRPATAPWGTATRALALGAAVSYFLWPMAAPAAAAVVLIKAPGAGGMFISRGANPQIYFARQLLGDQQLDSLSITELEQLQQQLEGSLKQIRSRKNQLMFNSISEVQKKNLVIQSIVLVSDCL